MRIRYDKITIESILMIQELFPDYNIICDGDMKEIILKEKTKEEKKNECWFNRIYGFCHGIFNMHGFIINSLLNNVKEEKIIIKIRRVVFTNWNLKFIMILTIATTVLR